MELFFYIHVFEIPISSVVFVCDIFNEFLTKIIHWMKPSTFSCKYEKEDGVISVNPTRIEWKSNNNKIIITTPFEELQSNFLF